MQNIPARFLLACACSVIIAMLGITQRISFAATLEWDRNSETDLKDYQVWACFTPSCVVIKSPTMLQPGTVTQTTVGVKPSYTIDLAGKEGSIAVSARDQSLNESGLSVSVPFDQRPPAVPVNPAFR